MKQIYGKREEHLKGNSSQGADTYTHTYLSIMPPSRVKEEPQVRNESGVINVNNYQNTSITSPMRRIPSFINDEDDVEEEECDMLNGKVDYEIALERTVKSSPSGQNKRKRNHPTEVLENEFGQLNRSYEDQFQSISFHFYYI